MTITNAEQECKVKLKEPRRQTRDRLTENAGIKVQCMNREKQCERQWLIVQGLWEMELIYTSMI